MVGWGDGLAMALDIAVSLDVVSFHIVVSLDIEMVCLGGHFGC